MKITLKLINSKSIEIYLNLPVFEVFVRPFVDGVVMVTVEQFSNGRTPVKGMEKREK